MTVRLARDNGAALVMVIMALSLLTSLSVALLLASSAEVMTAANFTAQRAALYAADAILERGMIDVAAVADWDALAAGSIVSSFTDGPAAGGRRLDDGTEIDVGTLVDAAACHKRTPCTDAELDAVTPDRPWGTKNPRWHLYAYGRLRDLLPEAAVGVPWYVALMVAAHPLGSDAIALRAEAFGPHHAHSVVELTAAHDDTDYNKGSTPRTLSWREVR
ncbi:MAG TPA: pilus assembly PilX N-terminal domain-containing protein [Vicinamibacterales bacterium]|nr:pilus assembly PilX N-terminal domain-containing protein [Vicinamibacterales bacterium]